MSLPAVSDPAGILIVALPLASVVAVDVKAPLVSVTAPVGIGFPVPPFTATVTESVCVVEMLEEAGVTVAVGRIVVTVTAAVPVLALYVAAPVVSGE